MVKPNHLQDHLQNHLPTIVRVVSIETDEVSVDASKFIYDFETNGVPRINRALNEHVQSLRNVLRIADLPNIRVIQKRDDSSNTQANMRIVIHAKGNGTSCQDLSECSHVISLEIADDEFITANGDYSLRIVSTDRELIYNIIVDVMLDVLMFHAHSLGFYYHDVPERAWISGQKVEYCTAHSMASYLDKFVKVNKYTSFATYFRTDDIINYIEYTRVWEDFARIMCEPFAYQSSEELVNHILKNHIKSGQISERRLLNMIKGKTSGKYVLVRVDRKPTTAQAKRLSSLFSGTVKIGKLRIVPDIKRYTYLKFHSCLGLYPFVIK